MPKGMCWVGLDVHAHATVAAVFDDRSGEVITRGLPGRPHEALAFLRELERPVRAVYEAGPTGYGLVRRARAEGIDVCVCAPGRSERGPRDRVKTDKRDAIRLARRLAAGELTLLWVPSVEQEQLRDLVRCREDIRADLIARGTGWGSSCCDASATSPGPGRRGRRHTARGWRGRRSPTAPRS